VRIDADPFAFFHPESRIAQALAHFAQRQFGLYSLDVALIPRDRRLDADDRAAAERFIRIIEDRPQDEMRKVISTLQFSERQRSLGLVDLRRAVFFFELFTGWARDLQGSGAVRATFMANDTGSGFRPLVEAVRGALPTDRFECVYTGAVAQVVLLSEGLIGGIAKGLTVALVVMAVVCAVLFQSTRLAAIAFLPNAFPVVTVFGLMGMCNVPLNSGSAMVATIALGIALNDTVHFLLYYRRCRQEGDGADEAVARTFREIGRPLVLTSAVNCAGFSIFLLSDFRPLYHFGVLSAAAMAAALVGDLLLLPALLRVFDRSGGREGVSRLGVTVGGGVAPLRGEC
jgi:predicted RND superfamily exporter protein